MTNQEMLEKAIVETGERMLPYFRFNHLPADLSRASEGFAVLAAGICMAQPSSAERTAGLRKLLEAKDCIVRAQLDARGADSK